MRSLRVRPTEQLRCREVPDPDVAGVPTSVQSRFRALRQTLEAKLLHGAAWGSSGNRWKQPGSRNRTPVVLRHIPPNHLNCGAGDGGSDRRGRSIPSRRPQFLDWCTIEHPACHFQFYIASLQGLVGMAAGCRRRDVAWFGSPGNPRVDVDHTVTHAGSARTTCSFHVSLRSAIGVRCSFRYSRPSSASSRLSPGCGVALSWQPVKIRSEGTERGALAILGKRCTSGTGQT